LPSELEIETTPPTALPLDFPEEITTSPPVDPLPTDKRMSPLLIDAAPLETTISPLDETADSTEETETEPLPVDPSLLLTETSPPLAKELDPDDKESIPPTAPFEEPLDNKISPPVDPEPLDREMSPLVPSTADPLDTLMEPDAVPVDEDLPEAMVIDPDCKEETEETSTFPLVEGPAPLLNTTSPPDT